MKLNESQIENLYKFTRQHYVYHYDVQSELVDHLANDIEEIWKENPKISFEDARNKAFKKFGIFGFMDVVEAKQKQMNKRYWKILWRFVKEWFTFPKLLKTLSLFVIFVYVLKLKEAPFILIFCLLILATFELISGLIIKYKIRKRKKSFKKTFLLEEIIHKTKNGVLMMIILNVSNILTAIKIDFHSLSIYWILIFAFFFTILILCFYITEFLIPKKAEELLQETYPEYKIVKNL